MKIITVFRHGQTDWNRDGRIQGHLDVPLNEIGRAQARALAPVVRRLGIQAFLSSDLSRARETAELALAIHAPDHPSLPLATDPRLREIQLGRLQGMSREEIEADLGVDFSERLRAGPLSDADVAEIGAETGEQVYERALSAIVDFLAKTPFDRVGVSTHGGVLRRLIQYSWTTGEFPPPVPNGVIYTFQVDVQARHLSFVASSQLRVP